MLRVLGLDPSLTSSGLCAVQLDEGEPRVRCTIVTSHPGKQKTYLATSERIAKIVEQIQRAAMDADLVVMEGPSFSSKSSSLHVIHWLWGRLFDGLAEIGKPPTVVTPSMLKKYATGKGNSGKDAVLAAAVRRWPAVAVDGNDVADALILAAIGCRHLGYPIDSMPVAHWETVMPKLAA